MLLDGSFLKKQRWSKPVVNRPFPCGDKVKIVSRIIASRYDNWSQECLCTIFKYFYNLQIQIFIRLLSVFISAFYLPLFHVHVGIETFVTGGIIWRSWDCFQFVGGNWWTSVMMRNYKFVCWFWVWLISVWASTDTVTGRTQTICLL